MESLHYLVLVNLYLLLFYGFYSLLLRNETFFNLNRIYLLAAGTLSFMIPFIQLEWIKSLFITSKVQEVTFIYSMIGTTTYTSVAQTSITIGDVLALIYLTGLAFFIVRFIYQLISIQIHLNKRKTGEAFSFFKQIKVDSRLANQDVILEHEQVHAKQLHSADVILFELIAIINWFNPVVYFYKKAIKNLHEYTADEIAASYVQNKNNYSMILLSNAFGVEPHQLTNSFFNKSLLKQRIYMLNKTKSKKAAILKYGLSAPLFAGMLILSSATIKEKVEASEQIAKLKPHNLREAVSAAIPETISKRFKSNLPVSSYQSSKEISTFIDDVTSSGDTSKKAQGINIRQQKETIYSADSVISVIEKNSFKVRLSGNPQIVPKMTLQFPNTLYTIDGKEANTKTVDALNPTDMLSINVLKDQSAIDKYGNKGKNGVIEITIKGDKAEKLKEVNSHTIQILPFPKGPLYIVDGHEMTQEEVNKIDPQTIESMEVLKGEAAKEEYGVKGNNGVTILTLEKK